MSDVGARIRAARVRRGWTQARLGRAVGLTGQHMSAVELGTRRPDAATVARVAAALGVPVADLTGPPSA